MSTTKGFEKDLQKLDEIVNTLNTDIVTLHEGLELLEKGVKLVKKCNSQLEFGRGKLQMLLEEEDMIVLEKFDLEGDVDEF